MTTECSFESYFVIIADLKSLAKMLVIPGKFDHQAAVAPPPPDLNVISSPKLGTDGDQGIESVMERPRLRLVEQAPDLMGEYPSRVPRNPYLYSIGILQILK